MKGERRLAENVDVIRAIFHEWDTGAPPPNFALLPSLVVAASTSIDANGEDFPKPHSSWFVDHEHPISAQDFHGIMERMIEVHGSDPDAKDLAACCACPAAGTKRAIPTRRERWHHLRPRRAARLHQTRQGQQGAAQGPAPQRQRRPATAQCGPGSEKDFVAVANISGVMIAYAAPGENASAARRWYAKALAEEIVKTGIESVVRFHYFDQTII